METIAAIAGLSESGVLRGHATRPLPIDVSMVIEGRAGTIRKFDPIAGVRHAEAVFARDDAMLVNALKESGAKNLSVASLYQLQVRTILFKVKHEAMTGIVTNLNQSIKTILNAA
ncbi:hypothetical protein WT27_14815 [Burkholderia territorii]|uniref:Uncharacterized protein n=1 Tax=Burkholderia territorii TaxID=1503055 RepID=A0A106DBR9_9BURK|nr:hypothetical protein [Burkholderia territorii]KVV39193.1 hypothetical protein WT27_14815 [Burkholderia territorii]KVX26254.1 hypothetical protein WT31_16740 [Burkholderia territorii]